MSFIRFLRYVPVLFVFCFLALRSDHPPSIPAAFATTGVTSEVSSYGGCALHGGFTLIPHTGRQHIIDLVHKLAPAAGESPWAYSIDVIQENSGPEYINAMTCANSKVIWVSKKAVEELYGYEPALAYIVAHEIAHGSARSIFALEHDWMLATERHLFGTLNHHQRHEVAVDQRAADIMLAAGYSREAILAGAQYILWQDGAELVLAAGPTHPAGWDRAALLCYYLERSPVSSAAMAGKVLPR